MFLKRSKKTIYSIFNTQNPRSKSPEQPYGFFLTTRKYDIKRKLLHNMIHNIAQNEELNASNNMLIYQNVCRAIVWAVKDSFIKFIFYSELEILVC